MSALPVVNPADLVPQPIAIDTSTQESLRAAWVTRMAELLPTYDVAMLRSDSGGINADALSFLRLGDRYHVNDVYRAGLLAFAKGTDLDALAANLGLKRSVYLPATATADAVVEDDDELLVECWLTMQRWGRGGTLLGMESAARRLAMPDIDDARAHDIPGQGRMRCVLLPRRDLDAAGQAALLGRVGHGLLRRDTRFGSVPCDPMLAELLGVDLVIRLGVLRGASQDAAVQAAYNAVASYFGRSRRIGRLVALSRVEGDACVTNAPYAHVSGMPGDLQPTRTQAVQLNSLQIIPEVADG